MDVDLSLKKKLGESKKRPQIEKLKGQLRGDIVLVWKLDRLGSSIRDSLDLICGFDTGFQHLQGKKHPKPEHFIWIMILRVNRQLLRSVKSSKSVEPLYSYLDFLNVGRVKSG